MTVPGVSAENRQNYAQDLQLSVRGFGARSSFGVRGVRLYSDGIPGTMPDGQGEFSQFDLGSAGRMEVLRGPFSALYGNSSGGVISLFTEEAPAGYYIDGTAQYGTFNTQRYALKTHGRCGHRQLRGRRRAFSNRRLSLSQQGRAREFQQCPAADVQRRGQAHARRQRRSDALRAGSARAHAGAAVLEPEPGGHRRDSLQHAQVAQSGAGGRDLRLQLQRRGRALEHDLRGPSRAPRNFNRYRRRSRRRSRFIRAGSSISTGLFTGIDTHVTDQRDVGRHALQTVGGIAYDDLEETRLGYLNYVGDELGVEGAMRRDEANHVYDFDQYLQTQWDPDALWRVTAGVRNNLVEVSSNDHLPGHHRAALERALHGGEPRGRGALPCGSRSQSVCLLRQGFRDPDAERSRLPLGQRQPARASISGCSPRAATTTRSASRRARERCAPSSPASTSRPATSSRCCRTSTAARSSRTSARPRATARKLAVDASVGGRLLRPGRLYLHPRRGGSGLHHLRGHAVSARDGRARELLARRAAECPVSGPHLELRAARILDHARGAGTGRNLRR